MSLTNFEINLQLKWSEKCIFVAATAANQVPEFKITDFPVQFTINSRSTLKLLKQ